MNYEAGLAQLTWQVLGVCEENDERRLKPLSVVQADISCAGRSTI